MPFIRGQSGNPLGFRKSPLRREFEKRIRDECTDDAIAALKDAIAAREAWAVVLALAYGYGKPADHVELTADPGDEVRERPTAELLRLVRGEPK